MALGQAAGIAAGLSIEDEVIVRRVDLAKLQSRLLKEKAVLIYFNDITPEHPAYEAVQYFGLRGLLPEWQARADEKVTVVRHRRTARAAAL